MYACIGRRGASGTLSIDRSIDLYSCQIHIYTYVYPHTYLVVEGHARQRVAENGQRALVDAVLLPDRLRNVRARVL